MTKPIRSLKSAAAFMTKGLEAESLIEKQARAAVACIDAASRAPEALPAADLPPKATGHTPEGETGATGEICPAVRDAGEKVP